MTIIRTLYYNIQKENTLHLALRLSGGMQIFVKNDDGNFFVVVVPTDTTKDVKIKIQSQKGYSLAQQNLKVDFGGIKIRMEDGRTLASYQIRAGQTVYLNRYEINTKITKYGILNSLITYFFRPPFINGKASGFRFSFLTYFPLVIFQSIFSDNC